MKTKPPWTVDLLTGGLTGGPEIANCHRKKKGRAATDEINVDDQTSVDGGHGVRGSSHKRVAVVGISISSGLRISRPLAIVVSKGIGVSVVAVSVAVSVGESMAVVVAKVVAVAVAMGVVGVSISIGLSCHGSKEAQSSNGLKMKLEFGKGYREDLKRKFCYQKFSPRISS